MVTVNPVTLGLIAGAFTTFASLPQIAYVIRTRSMKDISLTTLCMFAFGVTLWLAYGLIIHATPVVVWNAMSLLLYTVQLGLKFAMSPRGEVILGQLRRLPIRGTA